MYDLAMGCTVNGQRVPLRPAIRSKAVVGLLTILIGSQGVDPQMSRAQTPTPITPSGLGTQVNLSTTPPAGNVQYDITGGTRPGNGPNLFHSFGDFNISTITSQISSTRPASRPPISSVV